MESGVIAIDQHHITMACDWCASASRWVIREGLSPLPGEPDTQVNYACDSCRTQYYSHCEFTARCTDGSRLTYLAIDFVGAMRQHNRARPDLRAAVTDWTQQPSAESSFGPMIHHWHEPDA